MKQIDSISVLIARLQGAAGKDIRRISETLWHSLGNSCDVVVGGIHYDFKLITREFITRLEEKGILPPKDIKVVCVW